MRVVSCLFGIMLIPVRPNWALKIGSLGLGWEVSRVDSSKDVGTMIFPALLDKVYRLKIYM